MKMKPKSRTPDKARQNTDKILGDMEKKMSRIYDTDPALLRIEKKLEEYMAYVSDCVEGAYSDFVNAKGTESENDAKNAYMRQIRRYTTDSKRYNRLIREFVSILAQVNQKAIDVVNDEIPEIYVINYNAVAEDCRKVGIKVNDGSGKKRTK